MLLTLFRLLSVLPLPVLHAIGVATGWVVYLSSSGYRRRMRQNMEQAGFAQHLHAAISESGKNLLELPFVWCASPQRVLDTCTGFENWDLAQTAADAGRSIIFLTPHLGCFEILAQGAASRVPLTVMYRPPRQAALKPLIEDARARHDLMLAPANLAGVRVMLKVLRKHGAIGLLPDQVPQQGEGVFADFFGRPAYTMTLPARLQQLSGATLLLAWGERLPRGRGYTLRLEPFTATLGDSPEQQARAINAAMEQLIAKCPAQYFWSYNRYKVPADVRAATSQTGEA